MFKFLKEKLKQGIAKFSKKIDEEGKEVVEKPAEEKKIAEVKEKPEIKKEKTVLPLNRDQALELLKKHNPDKSDFNHYFESEAIMKALAKKLGEDEETWAMLGLLHDVDWGLTKNNTKEHLTKAPSLLKEAGFDDNFIQIILSHGYGFDCAGLKDKKRTKNVEYALACSETITGLIHAYALIRGSMQGMKAKGLKKKFKDKAFAATVNRDIIRECEKLGLELSEFFELAINAVKGIAEQVGIGKIQVEEAPKVEEKPKEEKKVEEKPKETPKEVQKEEKPAEKKGFFGALKEKITAKKINEEQFEKLFWNLEVILLENNVAVEVIGKIKQDLKVNLVDKPLLRSRIEQIIEKTLKDSIKSLLNIKTFDLLKKVKEKKPYVICFIGINGSGKTTTIAKIAKLLQNNKLSCVLSAADTFRAAAIDQLQIHADKLGVKLIKHEYGSDPAAVAYDAIEHAKSKKIDVVLIDTAGRMHSNINLTDEMKKIVRVAKPDLKIFVGESITGNDCVEQAKKFDEAVGIDAIILSKSDVDEKGGASVSISYVTKKPIIYIGTGQEYEDLKKFDSAIVLNNLGLA